MIRAWLLYLDKDQKAHFEERDGTSFQSTNPKDWGIAGDADIILVLQNAHFLQAWVDGKEARIA